MIQEYIEILKRLNLRMGLNEGLAIGIAETVSTLSLLLISIGLFFLIKFILKKSVYKAIMRSTNQFDDLHQTGNRLELRHLLGVVNVLQRNQDGDDNHGEDDNLENPDYL